jgi:hypothetical protein
MSMATLITKEMVASIAKVLFFILPPTLSTKTGSKEFPGL